MATPAYVGASQEARRVHVLTEDAKRLSTDSGRSQTRLAASARVVYAASSPDTSSQFYGALCEMLERRIEIALR